MMCLILTWKIDLLQDKPRTKSNSVRNNVNVGF
jgi:hypothetical protein